MPAGRLSLYDIALEGFLLEDIFDANGGELTPELEDRLDTLLREGPQKIESAAMVTREMEATADICRSEAKRLTERALSLEKQAKKLKDRIVVALDAAFSGKVKTALFTIYTQKAADSLSVEIAEEYTADQLHEDHPELTKTEYSLDKSAARALWDQNKETYKAAKAIIEKSATAKPEETAPTEQEVAWAREIVKVIPDCIVIEEKQGSRYLRIR